MDTNDNYYPQLHPSIAWESLSPLPLSGPFLAPATVELDARCDEDREIIHEAAHALFKVSVVLD